MTIALPRPRRTGLALLLITALFMALASPRSAPAAVTAEIVDRGIIQSVTPSSITLRALDGSMIDIPLGPNTRFHLNGGVVTVGDLRPGLVASVFHDGTGPARLVRAFGSSTLRTVEGTVVSLTPPFLRIRTASGEILTIRVGLKTRVRRPDGSRARPAAVRPGRVVRVTYVPGKVAELVVLLPRRG